MRWWIIIKLIKWLSFTIKFSKGWLHQYVASWLRSCLAFKGGFFLSEKRRTVIIHKSIRALSDFIDNFYCELAGKPKKIIYLRYAKCAGTFLDSYFDRNCRNKVMTILHVKAYRRDRYLEEFAGRFDQYCKFTFVRNPWAWQVSFYFHHCQSWQNPNRELFRQTFNSFEDWIVNRDKHTLAKFGSTFCWEYDLFKQICYYDGVLLPDFIGKIETMRVDVDKLLAENNISVMQTVQQFREESRLKNNVGEQEKMKENVMNATAHEHYSHYYTDALRDLVYENNKEIIDRCGYTFESKER